MSDDDPSRGLNQNISPGRVQLRNPAEPRRDGDRQAERQGVEVHALLRQPAVLEHAGLPERPNDPSYPDVRRDLPAEAADGRRPPPYGSPDGRGRNWTAYDVTSRQRRAPTSTRCTTSSDDPMELSNRYDDGVQGTKQTLLAQLLVQQRCAKRLRADQRRGAGAARPAQT